MYLTGQLYLKLCFHSCSRPEQKVTISLGVLQRQVKTAEEKKIELEEEIRKKQEALDQMEVQYRNSDSSQYVHVGKMFSNNGHQHCYNID